MCVSQESLVGDAHFCRDTQELSALQHLRESRAERVRTESLSLPPLDTGSRRCCWVKWQSFLKSKLKTSSPCSSLHNFAISLLQKTEHSAGHVWHCCRTLLEVWGIVGRYRCSRGEPALPLISLLSILFPLCLTCIACNFLTSFYYDLLYIKIPHIHTLGV